MWWVVAAVGVGVAVTRLPASPAQPLSSPALPPPPAEDAVDPFAAFLAAELPPADGFDFPVGDADDPGVQPRPRRAPRSSGWQVVAPFGGQGATGLHPGEDWGWVGEVKEEGRHPVHAVAAGRVVAVERAGPPWGNIVVIGHLFYENHEKRALRSLYAHLDQVDVQVGQDVTRRQVVGALRHEPGASEHAHLHLELRWDATLAPTFSPTNAGWSAEELERAYAPPSSFIRAHRRLFVPQAELDLVLVDQASLQMQVIAGGQSLGVFPVSLGQGEGRKRKRPGHQTPQGLYFVVARHRGAFSGEWAEYFGGHWLKINYPNAFDARFGREQGWITALQEQEIATAWAERRATPSRTVLGGGIGFHGWIDDWPLDGPRRLSFGCIVMRNADIAAVYERIPLGTMVVVF